MPEVGKRLYLPEGIDEAPTNVHDVLVAAHALLKEEDRWTQGSWYEQSYEEDNDWSDPYCGSWKVCAEGALGAVIFGAITAVEDTGGCWLIPDGPVLTEYSNWTYVPTPEDMKLYEASKQALAEAASGVVSDERLIDVYGYVIDFEGMPPSTYNDDIFTSRGDVLDWFEYAIEQNASNSEQEAVANA